MVLEKRDCLKVNPIQLANSLGPQVIFEEDNRIHRQLRDQLREFRGKIAEFDRPEFRVLEIGPQIGNPMFSHVGSQYDTLDICSASDPTFLLDICNDNSAHIPNAVYDMVIFLEVIEHVANPANAIREIARILKPGGRLFLSNPFQFRLHGPMPDYWRISEFGLMELLRPFFEIESMCAFYDADRRQMFPLFYQTVGVRKPAA